MVISNTHKFILLKPRKVAGTSIVEYIRNIWQQYIDGFGYEF